SDADAGGDGNEMADRREQGLLAAIAQTISHDGAATAASAEHLLHLFEEALAHRMHLLPGHACELLQQLALARGELAWRFDDDADQMITPAVAVQIHDPPSL